MPQVMLNSEIFMRPVLQPLPERKMEPLFRYPEIVSLLKYILVQIPMGRPSPGNILIR